MPTTGQTRDTDLKQATRQAIAHERERARLRREGLGIARHGHHPWALCLSGGGIRSATFCLGVLQGLARTPSPKRLMTQAGEEALTLDARTPLIKQFDYLSTVSGGGYVGAFFSAMFVSGRLNPPPAPAGPAAPKTFTAWRGALKASFRAEDPVAQAAREAPPARPDAEAAELAYAALREDPPERMHAHTVYQRLWPGKAALAWLRDNGRYLTPNGSGDMMYAAALAIRNWLATQYVLATLMLVFLSLALWLRLLASHVPGYGDVEALFHSDALGGVWWSTTWLAVAAVLMVVAVPVGLAFWFTHPGGGESVEAPPRVGTPACLVALVLGLACLAPGLVLMLGMVDDPGPLQWVRVLGGMGGVILLGLVYFTLSVPTSESISQLRVRLTQWLSLSLMTATCLAALAAVESVAQTAMLHLDRQHLLPASAMIGALVWVMRWVAQHDGKPAASKFKALPLPLLAGVAGVLLWMVMAVLLDSLLLWIAANGGHDVEGQLSAVRMGPQVLWRALGVGLACFGLAWASGQFPGFLNLSTFQGLYSARLTRTYLGASNPARFAANAAHAASVAEPIAGDNLSVAQWQSNPLAPQHLINVCMNVNVDPGEQLVQRDRKGKPLALALGGFYLDGGYHPFVPTTGRSELNSSMSLGEWVGVSGAAFSTGLGRATSLGTSLLMAFANLRLGRWWRSGIGQPQDGWLRRLLRTQIYLLDEVRALFHGTSLAYQYLSDGGHFENTAAYEMLRPEREVELIVLCDCGADPDYAFGDLANLIRLARIDHGVEVSVNRAVAQHVELGRVFGTPESFATPAGGGPRGPSERCAVLLDVRSPHGPAQARDPAQLRLTARIVLIKPGLLADSSADVANYQALHPAFPQESTADQFFDEAQWESYRKLGLELARKLFPQDSATAYGEAFWRAVRVA